MISDFRSYGSDMTYVNLVFPMGWLIPGIVYLTGLCLLIPLTYLKLDWINFGTVNILYTILEHSCREPEVIVKCCVRNLSNLVYCKVISRCGHRGFGLCLSTPSTSMSMSRTGVGVRITFYVVVVLLICNFTLSTLCRCRMEGCQSTRHNVTSWPFENSGIWRVDCCSG